MIRRISVHYSGHLEDGQGSLQKVSWGYVVKEDERVLRKCAGSSPWTRDQTRETALYKAIVSALEFLIEMRLNDSQVRFYGDDVAVTNRFNGRWKARGEAAGAHATAVQIAARFTDLNFTWIQKQANRHAQRVAEGEPGVVDEPTPTTTTQGEKS